MKGPCPKQESMAVFSEWIVRVLVVFFLSITVWPLTGPRQHRAIAPRVRTEAVSSSVQLLQSFFLGGIFVRLGRRRGGLSGGRGTRHGGKTRLLSPIFFSLSIPETPRVSSRPNGASPSPFPHSAEKEKDKRMAKEGCSYGLRRKKYTRGTSSP